MSACSSAVLPTPADLTRTERAASPRVTGARSTPQPAAPQPAAPQPAAREGMEHREQTGHLLERRQPDHDVLRLLIPVSPRDREEAGSLPMAEEAPHGGTVQGERESESTDKGTFMLLPKTASSKAVDSNGICSIEKHAAAASPTASGARFLDLTAPIHDAEQPEGESLRCDSPCVDDASKTGSRHENAAECSAAANLAAAAEAMSPRRLLLREQRAHEDDQDNSGVASPKTLFADAAPYPLAHPLQSTALLPEQQALTRMVQLQLKLPLEVAGLVARYMKDTVSQNLAASSDFRAKFLETREPSYEISGNRSFVGETLAKAEREVQHTAERVAQEEEERFHRKVVAAQVKQRLG